MWRQRQIDDLRVDAAPALSRVVCAVDPPMYDLRNDLCCIIVAGLGDNGHAYILRDASVREGDPGGWGRAVYEACREHGATPVAEYGNPADLVATVMRSIANIGVRTWRHRGIGRWRRLEPVAEIYAEGRAHHVGHLDNLEQDMVYYDGMHHGEPCERLDALCMAVSMLMLAPPSINIRAL